MKIAYEACRRSISIPELIITALIKTHKFYCRKTASIVDSSTKKSVTLRRSLLSSSDLRSKSVLLLEKEEEKEPETPIMLKNISRKYSSHSV